MKIVDSFATIGASVSIDDQVEAILNGFLEDYDPFVASIMLRSEPYTINEIKTLLLAQEERLAKHRPMDLVTYSLVVVVATWHPSHARNERLNHRFPSSRGGRGHSRPSYSTGSHSSLSF